MDLFDVYGNVRRNVVGQDEALKKLILTVNHNLKDGHFNKENIILKGERGTGKTVMCEEVAREMDIPFTQIDVSLSEDRLCSDHIEEALTKFAGEIDAAELYGIVLFDGFDKLLAENNHNNVIQLTKRNDYFLANGRLEIYGIFDISRVTFVAEGIYDSKVSGFNSGYNIINDELFNSRFTKVIETNPITEDLVFNAVFLSNISSMRNLGDIVLDDEEIDKIVCMVMDRSVGLHSASAVIDEVLYPKLSKKYFG